MEASANQEVYQALTEHQNREQPGWDIEGLMRELHRWKGIYVSEFKLQIPPVAFCVKHTRSNCYGYFRPGHNEFGLTREIAINKSYLGFREYWQVLGTLLHELCHAWQDAFGKPGRRNYHNGEFRTKAASYGLIVASNGVTQYAPESPFVDLLKKYGVNVPELPKPLALPPGNSKQKKWSCGCEPPFNARVAREDFWVMCRHCGKDFVRAD